MNDDEHLPAFPETATCPHCRGSLKHTARERCPAAPLAQTQTPATAATPQQPQGPIVAAGSFEAVSRPRAFIAAPRRATVGTKQSSPFGFWRGAGCLFGSIALMVCVSVYAWIIFDDLTSADQTGGSALAGIAVTVFLGAVLGLGILWLSWRAYAKVACAFLAPTLILLGYFMLIFAPVYRQINSRGIAEYRASNALYVFGTLTLLGGLALAVLALSWALQPESRAALVRWRRPIGAAYGVLLGLFGLMILSLLAFIIAAASDDNFETEEIGVVAGVIAITALAMQFFVPGMILVYHGIRSSIGTRTGSFRPPWAILVGAVFAAIILLGQANMRLESPSAWPMPFLHTFAAVLPGTAYVALAMRGSWLRGQLIGGITWRQITLAWCLAIAVGAMSAGFVNTIGGLGVTIALLVHNGAFEGVAVVSGSYLEYDVWDVIGDAEFLLTSNEQWIANIIAIAVIPPLGEEFLKGLSVRFMMRGNTTRGQAFALGAAAGAGFGFVEALLYGAGVVADDLGAWWQIMLIRAGSTSLHSLATGLVGVGWWYWSNGDRKARALALYFTAVLLHAIWNGFAVTLDSEIFWIGTLEDQTLEYVAYGFVIVLGALFVTAIPLVARYLREPPPRPVAGTPLGAMRPWMTYETAWAG